MPREIKLQIYAKVVQKTLENATERSLHNLVNLLKSEFGGQVPQQFNHLLVAVKSLPVEKELAMALPF